MLSKSAGTTARAGAAASVVVAARALSTTSSSVHGQKKLVSRRAMLYGTPNLPHENAMTLLAVQPSRGGLPLLQSRAMERMRNSPERRRDTK